MAVLVSPIVDIISRLWTCCARHTRYLCKLQENKILLRKAMDELKDLKNDVQRKVDEAEADQSEPKRRTNQVRGWLQSVETIDDEVEAILQKAGELLNKVRCLGGCCCPPNNCWSNYKVGKPIAKKIPLVDELKGKGRFEELTYILPPPSVQDMNLESTVGMESMFDKVWRHITSTDDKPVSNIIGLYGQGGVGKTTLLKKINNEFHNKISTDEHGFDYVVIFVVVSKPINYEAIQKKIGERLGLSLQEDGDEGSRAHKIFEALKKKNYVLLLDDIWEKVDLQLIGIPIHRQGNSKLLFTTRLENVCGKMKADKKYKVHCLPWGEAWKLFKENVGEETLNSFPGARGLAELVAKECDGLPLALTTLGRAMSTKRSAKEWKDAITTLKKYASDFEGMSDEVLSRLKLSYDYLRNDTIKSCFRYCALYPEDYSIEIAKLVEYWIAEGFLDGFDKLDEARNRGHTIIGSLKSACLLESSSDDDIRNPYMKQPSVKMHDVIRDLALWIVNDCRSSDESGNTPDNKYLVAVDDPCKKWENATKIFWDAADSSHTTHTTRGGNYWDAVDSSHITHTNRGNYNNAVENPLTSKNLLTLIISGNLKSKQALRLPPSFFQHMPLLRVLDLSNTRLKDPIPISICELHELQYLNLSDTYISELPVELRKLEKLKFLVLRDSFWRERRIPAGVIANLSELQVLDLGCDFIDCACTGFENWELGEDGPSFSELDGLKQLQEVQITITTDVALEKFLCNRKLQMVCTGLKFVITSSSRRVLDLSNFKSLKDINICGSGFSELEELELYGGLLSNLLLLRIYNLSKLNNILWTETKQPDILRSHSQSLHEIRIMSCHALKDLTWLVYMENLEILDVKFSEGIETIIEFGGDHGLEAGAEGGGGDQILLNTGGGVFRRLKTLQLYGLPKLKSICGHALAFPSIETMDIYNCPELKKLPLGSGSNVNNTLNQIGGSIEWWNELQWEDETIKSKFLPYLNKKRD